MKPALSLYLDAVRFTAAMVVYLGHLALASEPTFVSPGFSATFSGISACIDEAVIIFFVLSGFVIAHATAARPTTLEAYATARLARLYSVALPALLATLVLDMLGRAIAPAFYPPFAPQPFLGALLFLNQLWYIDAGAGSNGPYWSLNFEFWYYVLFGMVLFLRGWQRVLAVLATLLVCGPQIALYSLLWFAGVWLHGLTQRLRLSQGLGLGLFLLGPVIFFLAVNHPVPGEAFMLDRLAWVLRDSNILHDSVIALAFGMHLLGCHSMAAWLEAPLSAIARPLRWLAGWQHLHHLSFSHATQPLPRGGAAHAARALVRAAAAGAGFPPAPGHRGGDRAAQAALGAAVHRRLRATSPACTSCAGRGVNQFRPVAPPPGHAATG
jgi:peptidoglycan/LPS O-acetylase OafA/YrhL